MDLLFVFPQFSNNVAFHYFLNVPTILFISDCTHPTCIYLPKSASFMHSPFISLFSSWSVSCLWQCWVSWSASIVILHKLNLPWPFRVRGQDSINTETGRLAHQSYSIPWQLSWNAHHSTSYWSELHMTHFMREASLFPKASKESRSGGTPQHDWKSLS